MSTEINQLKSTLKVAGYSITHPREAVFMALQNHEPLSIKEITLACSKIDRASVYRTILLYERLGIVQRVQIGWKYKIELSDSFHHHHHHLSCDNCGKIIPFEEESEFESNLNKIAQKFNFRMSGHQLEIQGICKDCLKS